MSNNYDLKLTQQTESEVRNGLNSNFVIKQNFSFNLNFNSLKILFL